MIEPGPEESEQRAEVETGRACCRALLPGYHAMLSSGGCTAAGQEQEQAPDSPVAESQDGEGGQARSRSSTAFYMCVPRRSGRKFT